MVAHPTVPRVDPVEFQDVITRRRMVRNYEDRPLPRELVDRILDNGRRAPSAGFSQGSEFLVLEGREQTERYWTANFTADARSRFRWQGLFRAPLIVVALSNRDAYAARYAEPDKGQDVSSWPVAYWDVDAGLAALLMALTAVDAGLGALFFAVNAPDAFRAAFRLPVPYKPVGALALGYPAVDEPSRSRSRARRPLEEVVHRGGW